MERTRGWFCLRCDQPAATGSDYCFQCAAGLAAGKPYSERHECGQEICAHGECWRCGNCEVCMPQEEE